MSRSNARKHPRGWVPSLVVSMTLGFLYLGPSASAQAPGGYLVFDGATSSTNTSIFQVNPDGSGLTTILNNLHANVGPVVCRDQESARFAEIAFSSDLPGNQEIFVMNADGSSVTRITTNPAADVFPSWSPDCTKIAFESDRSGNFQVYIKNLTTGSTSQVATGVRAPHLGKPDWSPTEDNLIAFESDNRAGVGNVWTVNLVTGALTRITHFGRRDSGSPAFSQDGARIAFQSNVSGTYDIYWALASGAGNAHRVVRSGSADMQPTWSPDDLAIGFSSDRLFGVFNLFYVPLTADGASSGPVVAITNQSSDDYRDSFWAAAPIA